MSEDANRIFLALQMPVEDFEAITTKPSSRYSKDEVRVL